MLSTVQGVTRLVVRYHFMGQPSRLIHTAKFGSEDDLNTKPKLKAQWEERVKKFASSQGPDAAGAEMATMSTPHEGGSDPGEKNHTTTTYVDKNNNVLVYESDGTVYSKTHVYEDPALWKKRTYRKETASEKEARLLREQVIAAKKAAIKAEKQKEQKAKEKS